MTNDTLYLFLFSANLAFIVVSVYSWLLKTFYVPDAYKEHVHELFPVQRTVAALFLAQLLEIPYLLNIGNADALFYANGLAVMVYPAFSLMMLWGYFFLRSYTAKQIIILMLPVIVTGVILTLPLWGVVQFSPKFKNIMFAVVAIVSGAYVYQIIRYLQLLNKRITEVDEGEYSNYNDFSVHIARVFEWFPLFVCTLVFANFLINEEIVKMIRDIVFITFSVWLTFYTLNPHRKLNFPKAKEVRAKTIATTALSASNYRLTEDMSKEMENQLLVLLQEEKVFLEKNLTMGDLAQRMNTNRNYLSEVIGRSEHQTFYHLINTFRIEYACEMISDNPMEKLEQVAIASGFTSGSSFSQVFKRIKNMPPKAFLQSLKINEKHAE